MGRAVTSAVEGSKQFNIVAGIDRHPEKYINNYPVYTEIEQVTEKADVLVDFSNPVFIKAVTDYCVGHSLPMVIATTGLSKAEFDYLKSAAQTIPVLWSGNMSLGVNLLLELVGKATSVLSDLADIEVIEKHHNQKVDAPSGTAHMIADRINTQVQGQLIYGRHSASAKRQPKEIGVHAVRGGTIIGEHTVIFAWQDEIIEIKHSALSRNIFALGALKAAEYLSRSSKGYYSMEDVVR